MPMLEEMLLDCPWEEGCIVWPGRTNHGGYGYFKLNGKNVVAHRVAFERAVGPIPDGMLVLHLCNRPPCINPMHLYVGTQRENARDRDAAGNTARGTKNGDAKLDEKAVASMREGFAMGRSIASLAREFGVAPMTAGAAVKRHTWKHV